jgi:predicted MFS family arabinose efflux permease
MAEQAVVRPTDTSVANSARREKLFLNALHVIIDGLTDSMAVLLPFVAISFGVGAMAAGSIVSASNALNTFCGLFTLMALRWTGYIGTLALAVLVFGCGFLLSALGTSIYIVGLLLVLGAAGLVIFHSAAFSYLVVRSDKTTRGKAIGDFTAIGDIGRIPLASFAGVVAATSFLNIPGWRLIFLCYGIAAIGIAIYVLLAAAPSVAVAGGPGRRMLDVTPLKRRQHLMPIISGMLDAFGSNQVFVFLPFLLFAKGLDPKFVGAVAFAFTLGSFAGKSILGRFVDRLGARNVFIVAEVILACSILAIVATDQAAALLGITLLLGAVSKGTVPVVQAIAAEPFDQEKDYQNILAIMTFVRGLASVVAPIVFGAAITMLGTDWSFCLMALAVVAAIGPLLPDNSSSRRSR